MVTGAGFYHAAMVEGICVDENGLRLGLLDHLVDAGKEDVVREGKLGFVERGEFGVCLGDADDLKIGAMLILLEEPADMSVDEASDADAERG